MYCHTSATGHWMGRCTDTSLRVGRNRVGKTQEQQRPLNRVHETWGVGSQVYVFICEGLWSRFMGICRGLWARFMGICGGLWARFMCLFMMDLNTWANLSVSFCILLRPCKERRHFVFQCAGEVQHVFQEWQEESLLCFYVMEDIRLLLTEALQVGQIKLPNLPGGL